MIITCPWQRQSCYRTEIQKRLFDHLSGEEIHALPKFLHVPAELVPTGSTTASGGGVS